MLSRNMLRSARLTSRTSHFFLPAFSTTSYSPSPSPSAPFLSFSFRLFVLFFSTFVYWLISYLGFITLHLSLSHSVITAPFFFYFFQCTFLRSILYLPTSLSDDYLCSVPFTPRSSLTSPDQRSRTGERPRGSSYTLNRINHHENTRRIDALTILSTYESSARISTGLALVEDKYEIRHGDQPRQHSKRTDRSHQPHHLCELRD